MTREQIEKKIQELKDTKDGLLRISDLTNPDGGNRFYSTKTISSSLPTEGVNAFSLQTLFDTIAREINLHVAEMKSLPYTISNEIVSRSSETIVAVGSESNEVVYGAKLIGENLSIFDIASMSGVEFLHNTKGVTITSDTRFEEFDSKRKITHETVMYKISTRDGTIDTFSSGTLGGLNVYIDGEQHSPDDIYIIGARILDSVDKKIPYYLDLSFSIKKETKTGTRKVYSSTIGNTKVGEAYVDIDPLMDEGLRLSTIILPSEMSIKYKDLIIGESILEPSSAYMMSGGFFQGNKIEEISSRGKVIPLSSKPISLYGSSVSVISLDTEKYDVYLKEEDSGSRVIFPNLIPLDIKIEGAFDDI